MLVVLGAVTLVLWLAWWCRDQDRQEAEWQARLVDINRHFGFADDFDGWPHGR